MNVEARVNPNKKALLPDIFGIKPTERVATPTVQTPEPAQSTPKPHEEQTKKLNNIFRTMTTNRERRDESTPRAKQQELTRKLEAQYHNTESTVHEVFPVLTEIAAEKQIASDLAAEDKASGAQNERKSGFLDPFGRVTNDIFVRAFEDRALGLETPAIRIAESRKRLNTLNLKLRTHSYRSPEDENDVMVATIRMQDLALSYKQEGDPKPYAAAAEAMGKIQANHQRRQSK